MFVTVKMRTLLFCVAMMFFAAVVLRRITPVARPTMRTMRSGETVFVLDAGHGGEDGGAVSADGVKESGINLDITRRLNALLRLLGEKTVLTRVEDVSIHSEEAKTLRQKKASDLKNRVALVNGTPGAVLLSIHQNSLPSSPRVRGAQVFYGAEKESAALAHSIQAALNGSVNIGAEKEEKPIPRTVYLMKHVTRPAVLVECGFLSNADEAARLLQPKHQTRLATIIAAGLLHAEELRVSQP